MTDLAGQIPANASPVDWIDPSRPGDSIIAGYGITRDDAEDTGVLRSVPTTPPKINEVTKELKFGPTPGRGSCLGDSGGPVYLKTATGIGLMGVLSRGPDGSCSQGISFYTDVGRFAHWLKCNNALFGSLKDAASCVAEDSGTAIEDRGYRLHDGRCANSAGAPGLNPFFVGPCGDFHNSQYTGAHFANQQLDGSDFSGAELTFSSWVKSSAKGVNFKNANLSSSEFIGADLTGADLDHAVLTGAKFDAATKLPISQEAAIQRGMILTKEQ